MAAYVIADVEILDGAGFQEYQKKVPATIAAYGGHYVARGGTTEVLEGTWSPNRCVILEFPSMVQCRTWWSSPEYVPLRALRERTTHSNIMIVEGI